MRLGKTFLAAFGVLLGTAAATEDYTEIKLSEFSPLDSGALRVDEGASVTLDLRGYDLFTLPSRRPPLSVHYTGPELLIWQFSSFLYEDPDNPDSRILEAVLDVQVDSIDAGEVLEGLIIQDGIGDSGGASLATEYPDRIEIDTGNALFQMPRDGSLIADCWCGPHQVLGTGADNGFFAVGPNGVTYSTRNSVFQCDLVRNGPAAAVVEFRGLLTSDSGSSVAEAVIQFTAWKNSGSLHGRIEMVPLQSGADLQMASAHLMVHAASTASFDPTSKTREVLTDSCYWQEVQNVNTQGPALLPLPQMMTIEQLGIAPGLGVFTRWPANEWALDIGPGGTSWIGLKLWPRELALTEGGPQWSEDDAGEFVEFTLSVHSPVPGDLRYEGITRASPVTAEEVVNQ